MTDTKPTRPHIHVCGCVDCLRYDLAEVRDERDELKAKLAALERAGIRIERDTGLQQQAIGLQRLSETFGKRGGY